MICKKRPNRYDDSVARSAGLPADWPSSIIRLALKEALLKKCETRQLEDLSKISIGLSLGKNASTAHGAVYGRRLYDNDDFGKFGRQDNDTK